MPNVLSPRDLVSRPDNMDETVPHMKDDNSGFQTADKMTYVLARVQISMLATICPQ